jgi:two-component system, OmpR family, response regulator
MRILVVDDEPRISADISTALTAAGYLADIATDGEQAWFRGDTEAYDLVILDLGLPKMDGLSVLTRWREAERHMPVLILTAGVPGPSALRESMPEPTTISLSLSAWKSSLRVCAR